MYIHINRQILYYEKTGEGDPILLLHGNGEDHTDFDALIPLLEDSFTVYAIDSRGHGASNPTDDYHYTSMADDIAEFITSLDLGAPIIYGFSDGGIVGLLVALHYPALVSKLAVSGVNLNPRGLKPTFLHKIKQHYKKTKSPLERMMLDEPDIDPDALAQIKIPVLITAGSHDIIKPSHTKMIASKLPYAQLIIAEGEDHCSYIIHSNKIYSYLRGFL